MLIREANMDEDRIAGTARKLGGKIQENAGRFASDTQAQIKEMANQAADTAPYMDRSLTPPEIMPQHSTSGSATPSKLSHIQPR